jgi:hypothetical protein
MISVNPAHLDHKFLLKVGKPKISRVGSGGDGTMEKWKK